MNNIDQLAETLLDALGYTPPESLYHEFRAELEKAFLESSKWESRCLCGNKKRPELLTCNACCKAPESNPPSSACPKCGLESCNGDPCKLFPELTPKSLTNRSGATAAPAHGKTQHVRPRY